MAHRHKTTYFDVKMLLTLNTVTHYHITWIILKKKKKNYRHTVLKTVIHNISAKTCCLFCLVLYIADDLF